MTSGDLTNGRVLSVIAVAALALGGMSQSAAAQGATIVELTQVACQFIESEGGVDLGYETSRKADCDKINAETAEERVANAEILRLPAGAYTFRVTNLDVPYELGFWLREEGYDFRNPVHQLTKTSISGGGLTTGKVQDYSVELEPGEYVYSCPLNTTPDYRLIVE